LSCRKDLNAKSRIVPMKACILQNGRLSPAFEITLVASSTQETFAAMETLVLKIFAIFSIMAGC
jgi:hypothetical protein